MPTLLRSLATALALIVILAAPAAAFGVEDVRTLAADATATDPSSLLHWAESLDSGSSAYDGGSLANAVPPTPLPPLPLLPARSAGGDASSSDSSTAGEPGEHADEHGDPREAGPREAVPAARIRVLVEAQASPLERAVHDALARVESTAAALVRDAAAFADRVADVFTPTSSHTPADASLQSSLTHAAEESPLAVRAALAVFTAASLVAAAGAAWASAPAFAEKLRRFGLLGLLPLYTRLARGAALEHEARARLFATVRERPGVTLADLTTILGLGRTAVTHHLRVLEREGLVASRREGRTRHFFENGRARELDPAVHAALANGTTRAVAQAILETPGVDQSTVCREFALAPSLAHWHLQKLERVGVVVKTRDGRHVRYAPGPASASLPAPA